MAATATAREHGSRVLRRVDRDQGVAERLRLLGDVYAEHIAGSAVQHGVRGGTEHAPPATPSMGTHDDEVHALLPGVVADRLGDVALQERLSLDSGRRAYGLQALGRLFPCLFVCRCLDSKSHLVPDVGRQVDDMRDRDFRIRADLQRALQDGVRSVRQRVHGHQYAGICHPAPQAAPGGAMLAGHASGDYREMT